MTLRKGDRVVVIFSRRYETIPAIDVGRIGKLQEDAEGGWCRVHLSRGETYPLLEEDLAKLPDDS